jgi:hypothetical protein
MRAPAFAPCKSKYISIQYQQLDGEAGAQLMILKEWEPCSSERVIVEQFRKIFIDKGISYSLRSATIGSSLDAFHAG